MKKYIAIILAALLIFTAGCAKKAEERPASSVPGYYSREQVLEGGSKGQKDVNLSQIEASRKQEDVCLTLRFVEGSILEGDTPATDKLPAYRIEMLEAPARVLVTLDVSMYEFLGQEMEPMGEFVGLMTEKDEEGIRLYFQFSGQVAFKAEENENEGTLTLRVRADDAESVEQYHVKVPYRENSAVAAENGLTPVLCDDGVSMCSLSAGFAEIEEADAQCKVINAALEDAGSDDTAEVILMNSGEAPAYTEPITRSMLTMMGALKTEDGVLDGALVAMDARFLCWTDDGGMVMARPQTEENDSGETVTYEELWVYNLNTGRRERLVDASFVSVQKAAFSKDKRYIAIVDQNEGARLLYLYDRRKNGLNFLSAEGMGDYTADFAWGTDGKLYAMCGEESMQLMAYNPGVTDPEEDALTEVEEREGGYGSVGYAFDHIYFSAEDGSIYAVDTETGERELFEKSSGFLLSPDGSMMLLIAQEQTETETSSTLTLCDLASGEHVQIASQINISGYVWSGDGEALFYLTSNRGAEDAEDYPVRLIRYNVSTGITEDMGALSSNSIFQGRTMDDVIVMFYQDRGGVFYPITYKIDLTGGVLSEEDELIVTIE